MEISRAKTIKNDLRLEQAHAWLQQLGVDLQSDFLDIAGDASFRRYFRIRINGQSRILMDAPPPGENIEPFMDIARRLRSANLCAPEIVSADPINGFLLLEDFGDELYRGILNEQTVGSLFPGLFDLLHDFALKADTTDLPLFNEQKLRRDLNLFPEWYLGRHRNLVKREKLDVLWDNFCKVLIDSALEQPRCFVHGDFHSCNLLNTGDNTIGIIDFQDAVEGPVSYDFVSLIWDRYITWPRPQIEHWMEEIRLKIGPNIEPMRWRRYCDLMGLQRNFKVVGIFARLYYRDDKNGYIEMIPRFYDYITSTLRLYPEFSELLTVMEGSECAP